MVYLLIAVATFLTLFIIWLLVWILAVVTKTRKVTTTLELVVSEPLIARPDVCYLFTVDENLVSDPTLNALNEELLKMKIQHLMVSCTDAEHAIKAIEIGRPFVNTKGALVAPAPLEDVDAAVQSRDEPSPATSAVRESAPRGTPDARSGGEGASSEGQAVAPIRETEGQGPASEWWKKPREVNPAVEVPLETSK